MTTITDLDDFKALDPFFRIIEKGLDGIADGGHFFDLLAEDGHLRLHHHDSRLPNGTSRAARPSPSSTALTEP